MQDDLSLNTTNSSDDSLSSMKTALCEFHEYDTSAALHTISVCRFIAGYLVIVSVKNIVYYITPSLYYQFTSIHEYLHLLRGLAHIFGSYNTESGLLTSLSIGTVSSRITGE